MSKRRGKRLNPNWGGEKREAYLVFGEACARCGAQGRNGLGAPFTRHSPTDPQGRPLCNLCARNHQESKS